MADVSTATAPILERLVASIALDLPPEEALAFTTAYGEALRGSTDHALLWPQFALALFSDAVYGIAHALHGLPHDAVEQHYAIARVETYYRTWSTTGVQPASATAAYPGAVMASYAPYAAAAYAAAYGRAHDTPAAASYATTAAAKAAAAYATGGYDQAVGNAAHLAARRWQAQTLLMLLRGEGR